MLVLDTPARSFSTLRRVLKYLTSTMTKYYILHRELFNVIILSYALWKVAPPTRRAASLLWSTHIEHVGTSKHTDSLVHRLPPTLGEQLNFGAVSCFLAPPLATRCHVTPKTAPLKWYRQQANKHLLTLCFCSSPASPPMRESLGAAAEILMPYSVTSWTRHMLTSSTSHTPQEKV